MAVIYRCDKCHKESKIQFNVIDIPTTLNGFAMTYELCNSCIVELAKFLKPNPLKKGE